ncbi:MAG: hypothetical protein H6718_36470 [Polyangiaceae bacterium]|nr:hypothetical protein [Polyangiaceae bacterium]MCB9605153.1 hypothetical protein [Polyangiaceae bacterium]
MRGIVVCSQGLSSWWRLRLVQTLGLGLMLGGVAACSASVSSASSPDGDGVQRRDTAIVHEDCDLDKGQKTDVNGDGRPDITIVRSGATEVCRAVDLNFDGKIDAWVYRDGSGQVRRRESDYDRDGRVDEISTYQGGLLKEQQRATTLGGKLDTWHFFEAGKLVRTERDSDGDAVIDQWWEYPTPDKPECPLIHSDVDGDGRPDPGATVDVCAQPGSGYVPPERSAPGKTGPKFEQSGQGDVPVEMEKKEGEGEAPPPSEEKSQ